MANYEQISYKNSMNETITFGKDGIYINKNDLRDYSWDVTKKNDKISGFTKKLTKKSIPIVIAGLSEEKATALKNKLFEVAEKDVLRCQQGKIICGDYYLSCYITGEKFPKYNKDKTLLTATLTAQTDNPYWIKEKTSTFGYGAQEAGQDLDYTGDFPFDYTSNLQGSQLNNTGFAPSNFMLRIYGQASNPKVTIAGHEYQVNVDLEQNEYVEINSITKKITTTRSDGTTENSFGDRNKDSYIFEKIPIGLSNVASSGNFKFDITLYEERSMPKWT